MAALVVSHIALRAEALAAVRAGKRFFILVDQLVDQQVLLFGEALAAGTASEGLSAVV